jgi:hypothetical protein
LILTDRMRKFSILLVILITCSFNDLQAQDTLPDFTLKNSNNQVGILWQNRYLQQVKSISVQRSFDSIKSYSTIVTVLNPQNAINGYIDKKPPYSKMYYRLFIVFDTGNYIFTPAQKPVYTTDVDYTALIKQISALYDNKGNSKPDNKKNNAVKKNDTKPAKAVGAEVVNAMITYPSKRVYTDPLKDNNIVINLPNVKKLNYTIKFFTEEYQPLFELKNIAEDYLILEKVNFFHSGWYLFEIYRNERLLEENKIFIPKDELKSN